MNSMLTAMMMGQGKVSFPQLANVTGYYRLQSDGTDSHTSANNMTQFGTPTFAAGKVGNAAVFNGTTQYMSTSSGGVTGNVARSTSYWVKSTTLDDMHVAFGATWSVGGESQGIVTNSTTLITIYDIGVSSVNISTGGVDLTDGAWHHVVVTYDGTDTWTIYVDGGTGNTGVMGSLATNAGMVIGRWANNDRYLNGSIDEACFWSVELTATEANELWNGGAALPLP